MTVEYLSSSHSFVRGILLGITITRFNYRMLSTLYKERWERGAQRRSGFGHLIEVISKTRADIIKDLNSFFAPNGILCLKVWNLTG